jgi:hypothetical protein
MPQLPGYISYAPFPEGFQGDLDETFQQSGQLAQMYISGNFLSGLYYPVGTTPAPTLPTTDQGPISMNGQWYFFDPVTGQYLPQSSSVKTARNYAKNATYQVQQTGTSFTLGAGITKTYDMVLARCATGNVLTVAVDTGPVASTDNDYCPASIKYIVGTPVATLAATDLYVHEHLVEGSDLLMAQGEVLSLSFSVYVNQAGNYSAYLTNFNRDMSYVFPFNVATANQWARIKIPNIPAMPTGTGTWSFADGTTGLYLGVVMGVGGQYQTANPKNWIAGFYAGTSANSNMCSVTNNQMRITGVKLEASATPTFLSVPPFGTDYEELIRYYYTTFNYQVTNAGLIGLNLDSQSGGNAAGSMLFPRRMAKTPTITLFSPTTFTANTIRNLTTAVDVTAFAAPSPTLKGVAFIGAITTPASAKSDVLAAIVTADARLA